MSENLDTLKLVIYMSFHDLLWKVLDARRNVAEAFDLYCGNSL